MSARSAEARKVVTIVFTDVVGSTTLGDGLDPETLRYVLSRYFDVAREALERHGGTVEKFIGDAVMAVFGIPTLHEDDALRAVRAALDLRHALDALNDELLSEHAVRIETRTGVNTGEVLADDDPSGQKLATGDAINVASRLEQSARAGEVIISDETHRLVRGAVVAESLAAITVKGKRDPLPVWRVRDLVPWRPVPPNAPFVGRDAELSMLRAELAGVTEARACRLVTIVGPPGIGKTRLARELAVSVSEAHIAFGRCRAYGESLTYAPLAEIVGQITPDVPSLLAAEEDASAIGPRIDAAVGAGELTASPEEIGWAFRRLFEVAAAGRPLVVVLDDIHWADPVLLDMLEYIASFSTGSPLLFVCVARPDLFDLRPHWATPGPNKTLIPLEPLTDDDARSLIGHLEAGGPLSAGLLAEIVSAAEGYPLFVEQMLALHADDPGAALMVPPSIQALLAARIDRLDPGERNVLTRASVEGRRFHRRAVAELLPDDARLGVGTCLLSLVRKQFLCPDRALFRGDDGFRFSHVLIRDVAYKSTPKQLRAELHEHYGRWLERQLNGHAQEYVEIVGFHLEQAWRYQSELGVASDVLAEEAGARLWAAARDAMRRMDIPSAVGLYERAAALLPDEPTGDLLREFAANVNRTEDRAPALAIANRAIERSRIAGNRRGELRARLDRLWMPPDGAAVREGEVIRRQVEELIPPLEALQDHAGLTNAWQLIAMSERSAGQHGRAHEAQLKALDHARAIPDRLEESEVRSFMIESVRDGPVPVDAAISWCEHELQDRRCDWLVEMSVLACTAVLHAMRGRFELAREQIAKSMALSAEFEVWTGRLPVYDLAYIETLAGNYQAAESALRTGDKQNASYEEWWGMAFYTRASIAANLASQHRFDEAASMTEALPAEPGDWIVPHTVWRSARGQALARLGRLDEAVALAQEAVARSEPTDDLNLRGDALLAQADVLIACQRERDAIVRARAAADLYERKGNVVMAERARTLARGTVTSH
jgi:class 3 adenylate cyclase/tetratricopeptide (TPR) repeat protein